MILLTDQLKINITTLLVVSGGETVQFTATANGINKINFMYEWKKRGSDSLIPDKVSGVNETVLTIPNVLESDEGQYYCIVTNEWGRSVESNNGNLTFSGMLYFEYVTSTIKIRD